MVVVAKVMMARDVVGGVTIKSTLFVSSTSSSIRLLILYLLMLPLPRLLAL